MKNLVHITPNPRLRPTLLASVALWGCLAHAGVFAFDASTSGTFSNDEAFPITLVHIDHPTVTATPFALSTLVADQSVNLAGTPPPIDGTFTFTRSGGETLFGTYVAVILPGGNPGELLAPGTFLFTGGTGQFAGASGGGSLDAVIQFTGPTGGLSSITWKGTLNTVPEPEQYALAAGALVGAFGLWRRTGRRG